MPKKRLKTLVFTGFSALCSFLSVKLGIIVRREKKCNTFVTFIIDNFAILSHIDVHPPAVV